MNDIAKEDEIIAQADAIKSKAFKDAEAKWETTPREERKRPWPRCGDLTCNRTLVCQGMNCRGFDF